MFSNRLKRLSLIVLIALVLTIGLLLLLPTFLKPSLNRLLPELLGSKRKPASVHIQSLSWTGLTLSELTMGFAGGDTLELKNLTLRYHPLDLLQAQINSLEIDYLSYTWGESELREVAEEVADDAREVAKNSFNSYLEIPVLNQLLELPLNDLVIHKLHLDHPEFGADLQVKLDSDLLRVNGLALLTSVNAPWLLELQLHPSGRWFVMLSDDSQLLAQQDGYIRQDADYTYVDINQRLDLAAFSQRLAVLNDTPIPLDEMRLSLTLQQPNKGVFPAEAIVTANAWLSSSDGKLLGTYPWQATTWAMALNKETSSSDWRFSLASSPQRLEVKDPSLVQLVQYSGYQQLQANCSADLSECHVDANLRAQLFNKQQLLGQMDLTPSMIWNQNAGGRLQLPIKAKANISELLADTPLKQVVLNGEVQALLQDSLWQLESKDGLSVTLAEQQVEGWQQSKVSMKVLPNLSMQGDLESEHPRDQFAAQALTFEIQPFTLSKAATKDHPESNIKVAQSQVSCRPFITIDSITSPCQVQIKTNKSSIEGWPIPAANLAGSLLFRQAPTGQHISSQLRLNAANDLIRMRINAQHNIGSQSGNLQWHLEDVKLNWYTLDMPEMLALTKFELFNGSVAGQGWVDWQIKNDELQVSPDISLRIDNLSGAYDNTVALEGLNGLFTVRRPFLGNYLVDAQISGRNLNPGIELKNILARSQTEIAEDFSWAVANIYEVRTDLLGGTVSTPLIEYDTRNTSNHFSIELNRILMSQVVAIEPSSEIKATGILDGLVPVVITPEGLEIPTGSLFARDPGGNVRYQNATADALAQSDQSMGMAMQLLSDFQYNKLQAGVAYQPDGKFNLDLQFQGKNPGFFNGKPTHLNVNLEYNLLDLLESLRIADDIITRVEEKYQ